MKNNYINIADYKLLNKDYKVISIVFIIFISLIIIIGLILCNNINYYNYYENIGIYQDKKINLFVNIDDINKIAGNNKLIIGKKVYKYKTNIKEELHNVNDLLYKEVELNISLNSINNNHLKFKIITKKEKLLSYLKNRLIGGKN